MGAMATAVKKLDLAVGEVVEIDGRHYEVVPDREGGVTIEPPITRLPSLTRSGERNPPAPRTTSD